ncbi:hypothetical protein AVEN_191540-1 [Araneus ventricosus]|uniref:Uncharacterized protein n=1 Tax=Araneus ventricosus TaxID=182803 RepID=A0A4Y2NRU7_ARAVE|nr:hypothetical protein AVEN_223237-1 [Araneus ventricosus]GBN44956.1 hypothetical protein AVEN_191540-1 [Araneus ventricosus]
MRVITTIRKSLEIDVQCLNLIAELCPNYNLEVRCSCKIEFVNGNLQKCYARTKFLDLIVFEHNGEVRTRNRIHLRPNKCSDFAFYKNFTDSEEYSINDAIPESIPTVRPQEPVDEPASDSQSSQESSPYELISRSPDKDPYRTRYGRVVKPPSRYVAKF